MGGFGTCRAAIRTDAGVGLLATLTMDVGFVAASLLGGDAFTSTRAGLEPVGRWTALLARGRLRFDDLQAEPPVTGEAAIGLAVHYATGITLTKLYLEALRRAGGRPSVAGAAAYGAATAALPLLIMYPSWGIGPFGLRSGEAVRLLRLMLFGHTVFGAAIGAWALALGERGRHGDAQSTD
jgi:hypothetical protein